MQEREADWNMSDAAMDEELSRLEALVRQEEVLAQQQAAAVQELRANIKGLMSDYRVLAEGIKQHIRDGRDHRLVKHAGGCAFYGLQEASALHCARPHCVLFCSCSGHPMLAMHSKLGAHVVLSDGFCAAHAGLPHCCAPADQAALRLQALQEDGRLNARTACCVATALGSTPADPAAGDHID